MVAEYTDEEYKRLSKNAHQNMRNKFPTMKPIEIRARWRYTKEITSAMERELRRRIEDEIKNRPPAVTVEANNSVEIHRKVNSALATVSALRKLCTHPKRFVIVENHDDYTVAECPICYFERTIRK